MRYNYNYLIINLINGKYYIGKHSTDNLNDGYMGSGYAIQAAISKYGKENFKKLIINFCESEKEAFLYEKLMIRDWMINGHMCYNIYGGGCGRSVGFKLSEQAKKHLSEIRKGYTGFDHSYYYSEEYKQKHSMRRGWHHTEEAKLKMLAAKKNGFIPHNKGKSAPKFKWLAPDGIIHIMDKGNAKRHHPDWKIIEE